MSIFDRKFVDKSVVDDTKTFKCTIIAAEKVQKHVEYTVDVQELYDLNKKWTIRKRYNEFLSLHRYLLFEGVALPFPPKKFIGNFSRDFILERQRALQSFLNLIVGNPLLLSLIGVKSFLSPNKYLCYHEISVTQICSTLRNEIAVGSLNPLPHIGWRFQKTFYSLTIKANPAQQYLLTWIGFGPDKLDDHKKMLSFLKMLRSLEHSHVCSIYNGGICEKGGWVIRENTGGKTIKDLLHGVSQPFEKSAVQKYCSSEDKAVPLSIDQIFHIVPQILLGLSFLHTMGIPYGQLHPANVLVEDDGTVKLLDIENSFFGLSTYYREFIIQHKGCTSFEAIDVYTFGLTLHEMIFCKVPDSFVIHELPDSCPRQLGSLLFSILSTKAVKNKLPLVQALMSEPLFKYPSKRKSPSLWISGSLKHDLDLVQNKILLRLHDDQKKVREKKQYLKLKKMLSDHSGAMIVEEKKLLEVKPHDFNGNSKSSFRSESPATSTSSADRTSSPIFSGTSSEIPAVLDHEGSAAPSRQELLGSIRQFSKNKLRKITIDNV